MKKQLIIEEYKFLNNEINEFEESIITGERKIENLNDWSNLKNRAYILKTKCEQLFSVIFGGSTFSDMEDKPVLYKKMEYIYNCIIQVEQNYMGKKLADDIELIMENIRILCNNNKINNILEQIEIQSNVSLQHGINVVNVKDYYGNDYTIASTFMADFVKNTMLQKQLHEDYSKAHEFVYDENIKR